MTYPEVEQNPKWNINVDNEYIVSGQRYRIYVGDEIALITTAPLPITELTQNHKGYDVPCRTSSCLKKLKCAS